MVCEQKYHDLLWLNRVRQISLQSKQNSDRMADQRNRVKQLGLPAVIDSDNSDDDADVDSADSSDTDDATDNKSSAPTNNYTSPGSHHAQQSASSSSASAIPDGRSPLGQRLGMPSASAASMGGEKGKRDWNNRSNRIAMGGTEFIKGKSHRDDDGEDADEDGDVVIVSAKVVKLDSARKAPTKTDSPLRGALKTRANYPPLTADEKALRVRAEQLIEREGAWKDLATRAATSSASVCSWRKGQVERRDDIWKW